MKIAVLGAGAGGCATAVELANAGHQIRLWARSPATIAPFEAERLVRHTGVFGEGAVPISWAGSDLSQAVEGVDGLIVVLPTMLHSWLGGELARVGWSGPCLLNPGHTGGGLAFRNGYIAAGCASPPIAEFSTLTYVARKSDVTTVSVTGKADMVRISSLRDPMGAALALGEAAYPIADRVENVIATGLMNVNLVLHAPGAILGASWVEATGGKFTFYFDGMGDCVARIMTALDQERLDVARAYGLEVPNLFKEMQSIGTIEPDADERAGLSRAIKSGTANISILAPSGFGHRYYVEDILYGLKPFVALAAAAGCEAEIARSLLTVALAFLPTTEFAGRDAAEMGISGLSREAVLDLVMGE